MRIRLRNVATVVGAFLIVWTLYSTTASSHTSIDASILSARRTEVEDAFQHAWDGYSTFCMGHDAIHPVSNTCNDDFGGWGATAIDALSTAIMFGNKPAVLQILEFIAGLNFAPVGGGQSVQLFEVTIRHFGGMLSAFDLLNGPFRGIVEDTKLLRSLYSQMVSLGDGLSCAFNTPSGVPRNWVNPTTCTTDEGVTNSIAGAGSLILEFSRLSDITHDTKYANLSRGAEMYLINPQPGNEVFPGLIGSLVNVADGSLANLKGSWGSLSDSFYEYLLKAYIYNKEIYAPYLDRWKEAADSTIRYIASHAYARPETTFLPYWDDRELFNEMDSLSWFAGGNFILGGMVTNNQTLVDFGVSIADTAGLVYSMTATGLGGEFVVWTNDCDEHWGETKCTAHNTIKTSDKRFKLRPEVLETWYYAYRATRNPKYRDWAWNTFEAINRVCKTPTGFSAISDVTAVDGGLKLDQQESFIFAEVLKYVWLIHLDDEELPFQVHDSRRGMVNAWVFNTEAHPLQVTGEPV